MTQDFDILVIGAGMAALGSTAVVVGLSAVIALDKLKQGIPSHG